MSQHLYIYVGNNPVLYVDPSGHLKICQWARDTVNWVRNRTDDSVNWWKDITKSGKIDWFLSLSLGAKKDENSVYHLRQDWWQSWKYVGYNDLYD